MADRQENQTVRAARLATEAVHIASANMLKKASGERFVVKALGGRLIVRRKADRIVE